MTYARPTRIHEILLTWLHISQIFIPIIFSERERAHTHCTNTKCMIMQKKILHQIFMVFNP